MTWPRITVGRMMAAVVVVAANLAIGRGVARANVEGLPYLVVPVALLHVAAWAACRGSRPGRAFWLGYLLAGGIVSGSLAWGITHPVRFVPGPGGRPVMPEPYPLHYWAWETYADVALNVLQWALRPLGGMIPRALGLALMAACLWAPQVAGGMLGGLAGWIAGRLAKGAEA
jgi:hypothetical protein